jgi:hypothetical protein
MLIASIVNPIPMAILVLPKIEKEHQFMRQDKAPRKTFDRRTDMDDWFDAVPTDWGVGHASPTSAIGNCEAGTVPVNPNVPTHPLQRRSNGFVGD